MNIFSIMQLPKEIENTINYLQQLLEEKGLYDSSLDFQIMNVASQIVQYNKIITDFLASTSIVKNPVRGQVDLYQRKNPLLADSINLSNSIRQNLKALGLVLDEKANANLVSKSNPLGNLINKLNDIDNDDEEDEKDVEENNTDNNE
jgi:hypothetical protein